MSMAAGGACRHSGHRVAIASVWSAAIAPIRKQAASMNAAPQVGQALGAEAGVSRFLDIGVGLPTQDAVHEVAGEVHPGRGLSAWTTTRRRFHGQALLTVSDLRVMVQGDPRRAACAAEVCAHLDFDRPVAIGLLAVLRFVSDADHLAGAVACLRDAVAPGSYLAISHIGTVETVRASGTPVDLRHPRE